jgi:hypothetical protein
VKIHQAEIQVVLFFPQKTWCPTGIDAAQQHSPESASAFHLREIKRKFPLPGDNRPSYFFAMHMQIRFERIKNRAPSKPE